MVIIVEDKKTGKQFKAVPATDCYMVYRKAEGEMVDGKLMTKNGKEMKNEWTFTGLYPATIGSAVYHCVNLILCDPDDDDAVHVDAEKARVQFGKILKDKLDQIEARVIEEMSNDSTD